MENMMSLAERPARTLIAVTASDVTVYDPPLKALYVGGTGDVAIETYNNVKNGEGVVTLTAHPVGYVRVGGIRRVMAATTATGLVGLRR
jgi:hypothetical protein